MNKQRYINFDRFSMDIANEGLWRVSQINKLRPGAFAVQSINSNSGRLVTNEELLAGLTRTFVTDVVLKVTISQLRDALDDDPNSTSVHRNPHRRGYRLSLG
ncbi:MAG TPA: helix-turn-helix domain-containing protein [Pyrinomonadaceae bacterium]|nr:helix-turn-helix domain-containing protein [Pyrinomonadaceae bacterium]